MNKIFNAEYVEISEETAVSVFENKIELQDVLKAIASTAKKQAEGLTGETSIERKELASIAFKVARSKTLIDGKGKDIVEVWKKQSKIVDAKRKEARDFLDALRDEIKMPVTEWEEEQRRIQEEEKKKEEEEIAARLAEIEAREQAIREKEEAERAREEAARIESERIEREKKIAEEAAARAVAEAEERAAKEKEEIERREREAIKAKEAAERMAKEAEALAIERERARVNAEKEAEERAQKARDEDKKHRSHVNNAAANAIAEIGVDAETAKNIVKEIVKGNIPNVSIRY